MKQWALKDFEQIYLTCIGLIIFLGFYLGMLRWVLDPKRKEFYQKLSQIPLDEVKTGDQQ